VWTALYAGIGYVSHLLVEAIDYSPSAVVRDDARLALKLHYLQLGLNLAWTPIFFGLHKPLAALVDIVALTGTVFSLTALLPKIDNRALVIYVPYCAWLSYATYLNAGGELSVLHSLLFIMLNSCLTVYWKNWGKVNELFFGLAPRRFLSSSRYCLGRIQQVFRQEGPGVEDFPFARLPVEGRAEISSRNPETLPPMFLVFALSFWFKMLLCVIDPARNCCFYTALERTNAELSLRAYQRLHTKRTK
jgi:hypothetical protein